MHENQRKILELLLDLPDGATLEEISQHLGITKTAAKEHVLKVEAMGYITFTDNKGQVGRPKRKYLLTSEGHEEFPRQYSWLSTVLLELLAQDLGKEKVAKLMRDLASKVASSMENRFKNKEAFPKLLAELNIALNELGYRTRIVQSDLRKGAVLEASNCVYHSVARKHPELCQFDLKFIEISLGGPSVKLESCIARGGTVCRFCIK